MADAYDRTSRTLSASSIKSNDSKDKTSVSSNSSQQKPDETVPQSRDSPQPTPTPPEEQVREEIEVQQQPSSPRRSRSPPAGEPVRREPQPSADPKPVRKSKAQQRPKSSRPKSRTIDYDRLAILSRPTTRGSSRLQPEPRNKTWGKSKQPWGTIICPPHFHKIKPTEGEIDDIVDRLMKPLPQGEPVIVRPKTPKMTKKEADAVFERLRAPISRSGVPDSVRTQSASQYRPMGVVNSFAWKGY